MVFSAFKLKFCNLDEPRMLGSMVSHVDGGDQVDCSLLEGPEPMSSMVPNPRPSLTLTPLSAHVCSFALGLGKGCCRSV